jgi:hypothetical protein
VSRPRKRRTADPSAVLAELRQAAEELVSEDDLDYFRRFGWDEQWARGEAAGKQYRQLVRDYERDHRVSLSPPPEPPRELIEGVDYVKTLAELGPDYA